MFKLIDVKFLFLYTYICGKIKYIFKLWKPVEPVDPAVEPVEPKIISRPVQLKNRFLKHCKFVLLKNKLIHEASL